MKSLGFSLRQIKGLLDRRTLDLRATLRMQREAIAEQRRRLEAATAAIEQAERTLTGGGVPDRDAFKTMMEVLTMTQQWEFVNKYYTEEQLASLKRRWSPGLQQQAERDWAELIRDVEAAAGEDPAGERGQALAARWSALIGAFTGGDPAIAQNLNRLYADQPNWPATVQKPYSDEVEGFIREAQAARQGD
ncbi:MAG: MerR family transcriptional regulator [Dehalococcoidia bacterium]